jgi:hypothetical protein
MRFLMIYKPADIQHAESSAPPTPDEIARMGKFIEETSRAGVLLAAEGCLPTSDGARVRLSNGKFTATDGPFTEAKEVIAGFALIQAASKEAAIQHAKDFLNIAGDGETEIRLLYDIPALDPSATNSIH